MKLLKLLYALPMVVALMWPQESQAFPCCSTWPHQQIAKGYRVNVGSLQSNLSLGAEDPTRSIQSAFGALQWNGGSRIKMQYLGSTSTMTSCANITAGTSLVVANSGCSAAGCSSRTADLQICSGGEVVITVYKGTGTTWKTTATSNSYSEVAGAVLGALARYAGASASNPSTCLSSSSVTNDALIKARNTFCNAEISQMSTQTSTGGAFYPAITGVYSSGITPTNSSFSAYSGIIVIGNSGLGGFDGQRGYVAPSYDRGGVVYAKAPSIGEPVVFFDNSPVVGYNGEVSTPANSFRRPSFGYDPSRKIWWLFAHDPNYEDRVKYWSSTDRTSWTSQGTLKIRDYTAGETPISTRMPVSVAYDKTNDRLIVAYVQYEGNTNRAAYNALYPEAGAVNVAVIDPANPTVVKPTSPSYMLYGDVFTGSFTPIYSAGPPAVTCSQFNCNFGAGQIGLNGDCVGMVSSVGSGSTRDLLTFEMQRDGSDDSYGTMGTLNAPQVGGQSDFPPSAHVSGITTYNGKFAFVVRGTDDNVYLNTVNSARYNDYSSCQNLTSASWSGWSALTASGYNTTQAGPVIRYRPETTDWVIYLGFDWP